MTIHPEHPFADPPEERDPLRRFRGRLAAPVTIVTAGSGVDRTGLTVSSLYAVEGEPSQVHAVVGPLSDLWGRVGETGRFVVHVCAYQHRHLGDVFAGLAPRPGGLFAGLEVTESDWGPVLAALPDRAYCTVADRVEVGWSGVVVGTVDQVEVSDMTDPLIHFRSRYRRLV